LEAILRAKGTTDVGQQRRNKWRHHRWHACEIVERRAGRNEDCHSSNRRE
jgi:hypothetical protein